MTSSSHFVRVASAFLFMCAAFAAFPHAAAAGSFTAGDYCNTVGDGADANCTRTFIVHQSTSYTGNESGGVPLHIVLHGNGMSASDMETAAWGMEGRYDTLADQQDFIVIYGQGVAGGPNSGYKWNDCREVYENGTGETSDGSVNTNADDVAYVKALIDYAVSQYHINTNRIYVSGYSNGGLMAMRLYGANGTSALSPYTIRAFATFAANLPTGADHLSDGTVASYTTTECTAAPTLAKPILMMFGQDDGIMCYTGGYVGSGNPSGTMCSTSTDPGHGWVRSAADTITWFTNFLGTTSSTSASIHNNCNGLHSCTDGSTILTTAPSGCTTDCGGKYTYTKSGTPDATVVAYKITGGGHTVPGATALTLITKMLIGDKNRDFQTFGSGTTTDGVGAADEIVNFFNTYN